MDITSIDKNLSTDIPKLDGVTFRSFTEAPFKAYGLYNFPNNDEICRLPADVARATSEAVGSLYIATAGGRVRFSTDSPFVIISAKLRRISRMPHVPLLGSSGMDIYINEPSGSRYAGSFIPPFNFTDSYVSRVDLPSGEKCLTVNLPSYSGLTELYIGIAEGSTLGEGAKYLDMPPIVYYGSSITQGACSCRPGNIYQNMIARKLNIDYINLGFSGNAKGEPAIIDYMASLEMSAFFADYDHNAPNPAHLGSTSAEMYKKIRERHPDIPYIMASRPNFDKNPADSIRRRNELLAVYNSAVASGDKNIYFIDGEALFGEEMREECTSDATHPNDLGFALMAKAFLPVLKTALKIK